MTKTSEPRTFSPISTRVSSFLNLSTSDLPTCNFKRLAISSANARFEFPLKTRGLWLNGMLLHAARGRQAAFAGGFPLTRCAQAADESAHAQCEDLVAAARGFGAESVVDLQHGDAVNERPGRNCDVRDRFGRGTELGHERGNRF